MIIITYTNIILMIPIKNAKIAKVIKMTIVKKQQVRLSLMPSVLERFLMVRETGLEPARLPAGT